MKKWQEERNYRRIYNEAGEAIANIITVDGVDVEVAEDVYLAYSQADRRERYVREEQFSGKILSLEQMAEDDLLFGLCRRGSSPKRGGRSAGTRAGTEPCGTKGDVAAGHAVSE